jgi:hypothetical protein
MRCSSAAAAAADRAPRARRAQRETSASGSALGSFVGRDDMSVISSIVIMKFARDGSQPSSTAAGAERIRKSPVVHR